MAPLLHIVLAFSCFLSLVAAHDNGMDMSMDGGMSLSMGNMIMYLHFTPGDNLWFLGWVASSPGAMVGACIGLFMLGMVDRWLGAMRAVMEMHWHARCASARVRLAPLVLTSSIQGSDRVVQQAQLTCAAHLSRRRAAEGPVPPSQLRVPPRRAPFHPSTRHLEGNRACHSDASVLPVHVSSNVRASISSLRGMAARFSADTDRSH